MIIKAYYLKQCGNYQVGHKSLAETGLRLGDERIAKGDLVWHQPMGVPCLLRMSVVRSTG